MCAIYLRCVCAELYLVLLCRGLQMRHILCPVRAILRHCLAALVLTALLLQVSQAISTSAKCSSSGTACLISLCTASSCLRMRLGKLFHMCVSHFRHIQLLYPCQCTSLCIVENAFGELICATTMQLFLSLLDSTLHTPASTCTCFHFLFTVSEYLA